MGWLKQWLQKVYLWWLYGIFSREENVSDDYLGCMDKDSPLRPHAHIVGKRGDLQEALAQGEAYTYRIKQRPNGANDMTWIIACSNSDGKVVSEAIIPRAPYLADDAAIQWAIKHGQWRPV
jgi:hypothetical protein